MNYSLRSLKWIPILCFFFVYTFKAHCKEGMWIPSLLGAVEDDMQALGMQLTADDLYSVNHGSLKDAIVLFGGGCTAELVSEKGLLFTNHHCGLGMVQSHSSVEHDYITDGFWASNMSGELACPGLKVTFIVRMDEVTGRLLEGFSGDLDAEGVEQLKSANRKKIEEEYKANYPNLGIQLKAFNYGNQYMVIVTKTYTDVRLVGAPPAAIGKFGGDTDNWVWPRHTGDFSVFRIYAGSDNEPAEYSAGNVPFKPAHHFPISLDGVHEGDFSMVYGFPGRTEHYLSSYAVDYIVNKSNPMKIALRETTLDLLREKMRASDEVRIKYTSKQSGIANAWKKWEGQNIGLNNFNAVAQKQDFEKQYIAEARASDRNDLVNVLPSLQGVYREIEPYSLARELFIEYIFYGPEIFSFAHDFEEVVNHYDSLKITGALTGKIEELRKSTRGFYKNFDLSTEKEIYSRLTPQAAEYARKYSLASLLPLDDEAVKSTNASGQLYDRSFFRDSSIVLSMLDHFGKKTVKKFKKDFFFTHAVEWYNQYDESIRPEYARKSAKLESLMQVYVQGISELFPSSEYWADANSTLRISYGKVEGSAPHDGMMYTYYTTSDGVLAKYDPENPDFELPARLVDLFTKKQFGVYGEDGQLRICYTGSNHTTGGNSGSPALNAKGELTGINFDRSWESTMSDVMYNPSICRNIMVDIRYVIWVIDVYAEADWLLQEMTLVKGSPERPEMN